MSEHQFKNGRVAWQKFGDNWALTGQYGMRPIILSVSRGKLMLRDQKIDRLIPFDPEHPDAVEIVEAINAHQVASTATDQQAQDEWADGEGKDCVTTTGIWHAALQWERRRVNNVRLIAEQIDPTCYHRYKEGEVLPRGEECSTVEKVNEVQEWRQRAAEGRARKVLRAMGLTPT